jgi:transposase
MQRYIGIDVHRESSTICGLSASGKRIRRDVVETRAPELIEYFRQLSGTTHVCIEETEWSEWLVEILAAHVETIVSVPGERPRGSKNDDIDAFGLAERLRTGQVRKAVYKNPKSFARLRELARVYVKLVGDVVRTKNRLRSLFRRRGVACAAEEIYDPETRRECLELLPVSMRPAVELLGLELDCLKPLRLEAQAAMVQESHRFPISRILETAPGLARVRVAQILPIVITPHRFRTKRQFWSYCGLGIRSVSSSDWAQTPDGRWVRAPVNRTRGLNRKSNRVLKNVFQGAAHTVVCKHCQPLYDAYERTLAAGTKPNLARLTLARKIAAITLALWKNQERFDPERMTS